MTILIRTPRGNDVLRDPHAPHSRRTKSLLMAIDGKSDASLHIAKLSSLGDVAAMLENLLSAGLVRALEPVAPVAGRSARSGAASGHVSTWVLTNSHHAGDFPAWSDTYVLPHEQGDDPFVKPRNLDDSPPAPAAAARSEEDQDSTAQQQVRKAVALMHDFVATHFAERAAELLPPIDKLTSVERIARSLKDYEALVAPVGKAATRHLVDLRATLTRR